MKTEVDNRLHGGDTLKSRFREMQKPMMPAGLEDSIMLKVRVRARQARTVRVLWQIIAALGVAAGISGIVWTVLHYLGVDLSSAFSFIPEFFNGISESIKEESPESPSVPAQIAGALLAVAIFYLSANGIISGHARRKALKKEMEERD